MNSKLIDLIRSKAQLECADTALLYASTYVKQLQEHINGVNLLSSEEISLKTNYLVGCLTITLDVPVTDLELLRARYCEGTRFSHVNELSYIQSPTNEFPEQGRLNHKGQVLFYAALAVLQDDSALRVALSESSAKDFDEFNILKSVQKSDCDLNIRLIGIWEKIRRKNKPYYLADSTFAYYQSAYELMKKHFPNNLFCAYQITDTFLDDILSRKGTKLLYQVTSSISSILLEDDSIDGVVYSSVEAKGEPVIALKPTTVDHKISHQWVSDVKVLKRFGYDYYEYQTIGNPAKIDSGSGNLQW
ncbi:hypothetical protein [Vibrio aestuarianus]|uniref:hypothetical protein n=1 Tax=Vibrio aestuarianus TaxID=28171 RepID=UPI00237CF739|nr:hypothetical protein [Vibrio aestuarianus]MDE1211756.1 hypothetical protein [Vibrio aestuarianus]